MSAAEIDCSELDMDSYGAMLSAKMRPHYQINGRKISILDLKGQEITEPEESTEAHLFDYQRFIVDQATRKRRYAIFADCGLGKTAMFLAWIRRILPSLNGKKVLIISPLMVVAQTLDEEEKFYHERTIADIHETGLDAWLDSDVRVGITNFEKFEGAHDLRGKVGAVVLDESSILKHAEGKIRTGLIETTRGVPWKLACSATPAPNDREEYANHATFLEYVRSNNEFFSMFFVNKDNGWEIKPHGLEAFYRYLSEWSVFLRHPERYGFRDNLAKLPQPIFETIEVPWTPEQKARLGNVQNDLLGGRKFLDAFEKRRYYLEMSKGFVKTTGGSYSQIPTNKTGETIRLIQKNESKKIVVWVTFNEEERLLKDAIATEGLRVEAISGKTGEMEVLLSLRVARPPVKRRVLAGVLNHR